MGRPSYFPRELQEEAFHHHSYTYLWGPLGLNKVFENNGRQRTHGLVLQSRPCAMGLHDPHETLRVHRLRLQALEESFGCKGQGVDDGGVRAVKRIGAMSGRTVLELARLHAWVLETTEVRSGQRQNV